MPKTIKVEFKLEVDGNIRQSDVEAWVRYCLNYSGSIHGSNPLIDVPILPLRGSVKIHWPEEKYYAKTM